MARLLDSINSPADVKKIPLQDLPQLAQEIRDELISVIAKTGGHLGPNLGVVELTIALHTVFDTPTDNFLFDVSHQAYVHKLLTGRRDRFNTIRQPGGLNGFMLRTESEHDCYGAGHAGTALSAALGMATARDMKGGKEHVIALCGDAAFTCGITYEALNNISTHTKRLIVILNDNEWSIDKNVGAIAKYLTDIVTNPRYENLHKSMEKLAHRFTGETGKQLALKAEGILKGLVSTGHRPSVIFEEMGLSYYGPIDGHDLPTLIRMLEFAKHHESPLLLHVLTKKSKGFDIGEAKQKKYHGVGPGTYDPTKNVETTSSGPKTYSQVFAETMIKLADMNSKVVAITGAMPNGTALDLFQPKHPDKYYDVGIAEEHAVLFAAGMATKGFKPFCAIYSTFLQRAFDQIVHDVCLQNLNVVFAMDRGGLSGDDGPTHHGLFDISYLRCIPNLVHLDASNEDELADMLFTALHHDGPIAIRYPRGTGPGVAVKPKPELIPIGKAQVVKHGTQAVVLGLGALLPMAQDVAKELEAKGYSTAVINPRSVKPLDIDTISFFARSADVVITMEDHVLAGGFGSAVLEELATAGIQVPVVRIGWPDAFVDHGKPDALRAKSGISVAATVEKALPYLQKAKPAAKTAPKVVA
ncbi:MAG TPA: 1-deoxy-D-xylulose-5-phosphate synthase [Candidatus Methylacidiphilales bacterium]|jgi:1-deoxy-D-xylulose-5-phosphate synthase|nr:1-deoxy-D-xylulose-5-phosphate synthase [Candidatus Methylacidiphilales bacterium]